MSDCVEGIAEVLVGERVAGQDGPRDVHRWCGVADGLWCPPVRAVTLAVVVNALELVDYSLLVSPCSAGYGLDRGGHGHDPRGEQGRPEERGDGPWAEAVDEPPRQR